MKILILSRGPKLYSTKRLQEACKESGHDVRIINPLELSINVKQGKPELLYKNKKLGKVDAVIPRIGASITFFGTAVVRQFEQMGKHCLNSALGIITARDKLSSIQLLARHNIGIPQTIFVKDSALVLPAIKEIGGAPVIIKLLEGTQGKGVILAETNKVAESIIETLHVSKQNVLIQKFVKESKGRDIRAIVVGNTVVASMRRTAQGDEFRSNVHRGGAVQKINLKEIYSETAIKATHILGLNVAGVDMLETATGPQIIEVNSSPGLEGIERATGVNVAQYFVQFLEKLKQGPQTE